MKKLSEFKGDKALDVIADLIEPCADIFGDEEVQEAYNNKENRIKLARLVLKKHRKETIQILSLLSDKPTDEFENVSIIDILKMVVTVFNDNELLDFFG